MTTLSAPRTGHLFMVGRQLDYWATVYRRTWRGTVVSSFALPLLYVLAMGVLLGKQVDAASGPATREGAATYLAFVVPGLVASTVMQTAVGEMTFPVLGLIKWSKAYYSMVATPLAVVDVVLAHLLFVVFRLATVAGVFLVVTAPFGVFASVPGVLEAFLACLLTGLAFAAPVYAVSARVTSESMFTLIYRVGVIPLFLFSGAFFPVGNLPHALASVARVSPLYQGVDLVRMLALGHVDASRALVHVVYLGVLVGVGTWLAVLSLGRRLAQ